MEWKIYYGDGSTFSSEQGSPEDAPGYDVQAIVYYHAEVGRVVIYNRGYYVRNDDGWFGVDMFGALDQMVAKGHLKTGRTLLDETYKAIIEKAKTDPDFPPKSALLSKELPVIDDAPIEE